MINNKVRVAQPLRLADAVHVSDFARFQRGSIGCPERPSATLAEIDLERARRVTTVDCNFVYLARKNWCFQGASEMAFWRLKRHSSCGQEVAPFNQPAMSRFTVIDVVDEPMAKRLACRLAEASGWPEEVAL